MYNTILSLLVSLMGAVEGTTPYWTCEVLSTAACVALFVFPFVIVGMVIRFMFSFLHR